VWALRNQLNFSGLLYRFGRRGIKPCFQASNTLLKILELVMVRGITGKSISQQIVDDQVALKEHHQQSAQISATHLTQLRFELPQVRPYQWIGIWAIL